MKERTRGKGSFDPNGFVKHLAKLVETLPSVEEQKRSAAALDQIIRFLTEMKSGIVSIPTEDDLRSTKIALENLSALFAKAKSNTMLATTIGLRSHAPRSANPTPSSEDVENARRAIEQFDTLPIDQVRLALSNKSLGELKALAIELGLRSTHRTSHEALTHQIATRITNTRGYRSLRNGDRSGET